MKRCRILPNRQLSPLVYLTALILLMEDWCWDLGQRLVRLIVAWPPFKSLEQRIVTLPPYPALCAFVLPAILLLPVKALALFAIAHGHPFSGVAVIIVVKIGGSAVMVQLYTLTRPALLSLPWFARWHDKFMDLKDRWIGRLKASDAYRRAAMLSAMMRRAAGACLVHLRACNRLGAHHASRTVPMPHCLIAIRRARCR